MSDIYAKINAALDEMERQIKKDAPGVLIFKIKHNFSKIPKISYDLFGGDYFIGTFPDKQQCYNVAKAIWGIGSDIKPEEFSFDADGHKSPITGLNESDKSYYTPAMPERSST